MQKRSLKHRISRIQKQQKRRKGLIFWLSGSLFFLSITAILGCGLFYSGHVLANALDGQYSEKTINYSSEQYTAYSDSPVSSMATDKLEKLLDNTDPYVLQEFQNDGGYIVLSSHDLTQDQEDTKFSNVYVEDSGNSTVGYISYSYDGDNYEDLHIVLSDSVTSMEKTLNHELGHYVDAKLGMPSRNDETFDTLYRNHFNCFDLSYYFDAKEEFFAETYSMYKTHPGRLENTCEATYLYMKSIDQQFRELIVEE